MMHPNAVMEEYLRDRARLNASSDHIEAVEQDAATRVMNSEQVVLQMQRDLEVANNTIRILQGERKTTDQMKLLYEEAKGEKEVLRKEAVAAATEVEVLKKTISGLHEKIRQIGSDTSAQDRIAQKLFETEEALKRNRTEYQEKEAGWQREKKILLQQVDQVNEIKESVTMAYERGKRAGEDESAQKITMLRAELEDKRRAIESLDTDLKLMTAEKERLISRATLIADLELTVEELRQTRIAERMNNDNEQTRLRNEVAIAQREAEDWRVAYETSDKHKRAMHLQVEDIRRAYDVVLQERVSLQARIDVLQIQVADYQRLGALRA
eukprot:TRINITY_DN13849_c0_g1_i1.p1 TRINITY_DN13849_c0_g1~~TRINITY_DN13849_c0_g1_i1.p1  ORF type:complete len:325 (+),score=130.38 TRINITY_DN13849_c0_g1_i1:37-1011(+)